MIEIAAAGDDHKALRKIAVLAKAAHGDVSAINASRPNGVGVPGYTLGVVG
jgi:hypothetical protein